MQHYQWALLKNDIEGVVIIINVSMIQASQWFWKVQKAIIWSYLLTLRLDCKYLRLSLKSDIHTYIHMCMCAYMRHVSAHKESFHHKNWHVKMPPFSVKCCHANQEESHAYLRTHTYPPTCEKRAWGGAEYQYPKEYFLPQW